VANAPFKIQEPFSFPRSSRKTTSVRRIVMIGRRCIKLEINSPMTQHNPNWQ